MKRKWLAIDLPLTDYGQAQVLQERCVAAKTDGRLPEDLMLLLEHPAVFTLGRNGGRENLMVSDAYLATAGVGLMPSERGGNITYHGPGQIVGYPVIDLQRARMGVGDYVAALEDLMLSVAQAWGSLPIVTMATAGFGWMVPRSAASVFACGTGWRFTGLR